ncbi:uncharacterized protein CBL_01517 [Carabus blaptoides fortunei]
MVECVYFNVIYKTQRLTRHLFSCHRGVYVAYVILSAVKSSGNYSLRTRVGSQFVVAKTIDRLIQWIKLVKRCTKPDRKEFQKIAIATAIGFCIMGFIGFFVKLIHIPINNIIVGS